MLIALYLVSKGLLRKPTLYLSAFLETHRQAYFDALTRVRESNDLSHWGRFFLQAVLETAQRGCETFEGILSLRQEVELRILKLGRRAENARRLLDYLYKTPKVTVNEVAKILTISYTAARNLVHEFRSLDILEPTMDSDRNQSFEFARYMR